MVAAAAASGGYWLGSRKAPVAKESSTTSRSTTTKPRNQQLQSEGQEITVPSDVDPGKIKDYELITDNEQFKIRRLDGKYTITLYAIINRPDQADSYRQQLKDFKYQALDYMRQQGVDPNQVKIDYEPSEAADL